MVVSSDMSSPTSAPPKSFEYPVFEDPIVKEVRRIRHELAARCGNNLHRITSDLMQRQLLLGPRLRSMPVASTSR